MITFYDCEDYEVYYWSSDMVDVFTRFPSKLSITISDPNLVLENLLHMSDEKKRNLYVKNYIERILKLKIFL